MSVYAGMCKIRLAIIANGAPLVIASVREAIAPQNCA
jgi:hypothetical protein